jgi:hypothetical protein
MKIIDIIKYEFGFSTAEAKTYLKTIDNKTQMALINGYNKQCKKAFYED